MLKSKFVVMKKICYCDLFDLANKSFNKTADFQLSFNKYELYYLMS